jgi:hypothetical protein
LEVNFYIETAARISWLIRLLCHEAYDQELE